MELFVKVWRLMNFAVVVVVVVTFFSYFGRFWMSFWYHFHLILDCLHPVPLRSWGEGRPRRAQDDFSSIPRCFLGSALGAWGAHILIFGDIVFLIVF